MWLMRGFLASVFGSVLCWYLISSHLTMCKVSVLYARNKAMLERLTYPQGVSSPT